MSSLQEYDVVKVVKLLTPNRHFDGTESLKREPCIGDIGAIVHEYKPNDPEGPLAVENVDSQGYTIWLADFTREELELVERPALG